MKRLFSLIWFLLIVCTLTAQEGAPLLTHVNESRDVENQNWAICQDPNHVMLFANMKGILSFDGQEWLSIRIPTIPFSMKSNPRDGRIFIGGEDNYGFLENDINGSYRYVSLSGDSSDIGIITKIIFNDSLVWFYGDQAISCYNLDKGNLELRLRPRDDQTPFTGMFVTSKNTFINVMSKGLFRLESDTLFPIVTGYLTENVDILFSLPYNKTKVLVGLSNGNISLFDGIKYYDYKINDDGYLKDNILSEGVMIGDTLYAFSTLDGGALVVDKNNGEIRFTINNQNELPDDEVFALGMDDRGGLWLSHQYGLTRADLNLPVANFSIYPGLKGNLTNTLRYNNELFVATSEGVFYLSEVKNYSEVQILVKKELPVQAQETETQPEDLTEKQGSRKSILTRIFGKKLSKSNDITNDPAKLPEAAPTPKKSEIQYTRKTINRLKSINYVYRKVDGLNEKCRQLVQTENGILAATNKGLFVINNHKAKLVTGNRYINFITWQSYYGRYYIAAADGYFGLKYHDGVWDIEVIDPAFTNPVYSITRTSADVFWLGVDNEALMVDLTKLNDKERYTSYSIINDFPQRYFLDQVNDSVFLFTEFGIYYYDNQHDGFRISREEKNNSFIKTKYNYPLSDMPWIRRGDGWIYLKPGDNLVNKEMSVLKIFNGVTSINTEKENIWIVDGENRLFRVDLKNESKFNPENDLFVKSIKDDSGKAFNLTNIVLGGGDNIVDFEIVAPGYLKKNTTQYQYTINRLMPDWSPWSLQRRYNLIVPVPGEYTLQVRAKDLWGNIGDPISVKFAIKAPFTKTTIFYVIIGFIILMLLFLIARFRVQQLHRKNLILEGKVRERTAEIEAQKEEITSSIEYASRIQMAMLPMEEHFKTNFSDYFIIFKPRDIVSGDFYWIGETNKNVFFTVADCTGHGVPGAFMSTLGISTLNEIITNNEDLHANTILNLLREKIKTSLHQTGKEGEATDGMDLAFCVMSRSRKTLQYSGAYNPLFVFQEKVLREYKGDRMPIGIYYGEKESFTNYNIKIKRGDTLYIFSDGLNDQFGGSKGAKYKISNLKKLLNKIHTRPMADQKTIILKEFEKWRGCEEQVDDITILGVRI